MKRLFERCDQNPIITPDHLPFEAAGVSNPGATEQDGYVVLLLRVEDRRAERTNPETDCPERATQLGSLFRMHGVAGHDSVEHGTRKRIR